MVWLRMEAAWKRGEVQRSLLEAFDAVWTLETKAIPLNDSHFEVGMGDLSPRTLTLSICQGPGTWGQGTQETVPCTVERALNQEQKRMSCTRHSGY